MSNVNIKLAQGKSLFHPQHGVKMENEKAYSVKLNSFWNRRLKDGDIVLIEQEKPAPKPQKAKNQSKKEN